MVKPRDDTERIFRFSQ
ncbi:MAG: hypothetical protein ACEY3D_07045 [Rickettsia sp.]|nr:hypothetical protein [Rickettsia endosymbiont of Sceptobius lativentris]MCC8462240.1 hypothetical protein [Rickettsia endosymbiont of Ecitomorpha arachnoides]